MPSAKSLKIVGDYGEDHEVMVPFLPTPPSSLNFKNVLKQYLSRTKAAA